ncbi:hypothetical protein IGI39_004285 [Enterococcus sp. AZ135]|uniref:LysR family transcriptional regulator n=1 Tax=unclassified Enterococcus TaxID=2608891 RepID=UPI003F1FACDC
MDLRLLLYFKSVANHLNFSEAAKELGIKQPTLSQQIKVLENQLGTTLFYRSTRKVELTQAGEELTKHLIELDHLIETIACDMQKIDKSVKLTIGTLPGELSDVISDICIKFHKDYPEIKIRLISTDDIEGALKNKQIDVGISYDDVRLEGTIEAHPLYKDDFFVISTADFELAPKMTITELKKLPMVLLTEEFSSRRMINTELIKRNLLFIPEIEVSSIYIVDKMVSNGLGVSIVSSTFLNLLSEEEYVLTDIADINLSRTVYFSYLKDSPEHDSINNFQKLVINDLKKLGLIH